MASASMVQLDEDKEEIGAPYRPIQDVFVPSPTKPIFTIADEANLHGSTHACR